MPWGFWPVDFTVSTAGCQRIAQNGVTRAVESRGGRQIRVQHDQGRRGGRQNDPRPKGGLRPLSYLCHASRPPVSRARSKIDPQQSKSWEVDNVSDDLIVDEFVWQHAGRLTVAKTDRNPHRGLAACQVAQRSGQGITTRPAGSSSGLTRIRRFG